MGGYSNEIYPQQQQQMLTPPAKLFTTEIKQQPDVDKFKHIVNVVGDTIGWGWVAAMIAVGMTAGSTFIFKKKIKKLIGDQVSVLNDWVNK